MSEWTTDANTALNLVLVRSPDDLLPDETDKEVVFHPSFTYPIYGTDETLYGYKDLAINLKFASGSLRQHLAVSHSERLPPPAPVDDPKTTLEEFIPGDYEPSEDAFAKIVEKDATDFHPYGERIHAYTKDGIDYEVWHTTFAAEGFADYHKRMQIFILLYIEGGSYIDDDNAWEFTVLYQKRRRAATKSDSENAPTYTYHFVGYSSLYPFYCFPSRVRMRLSQFVILPPWQQKGHGSELYRAIYKLVCERPDIAELTVEDPAEAFEDLRDRNDLRMLVGNDEFMREAFGEDAGGGSVGPIRNKGRSAKGKGKASKGKIGPPVERMWAERWRAKLKIAGRQFSRLVEMLQLRALDATDPLGLKAYRLQVKERLYRFNFEVLMQLEKIERQEKLEETFQSVREDYQRILKMAKLIG